MNSKTGTESSNMYLNHYSPDQITLHVLLSTLYYYVTSIAAKTCELCKCNILIAVGQIDRHFIILNTCSSLQCFTTLSKYTIQYSSKF